MIVKQASTRRVTVPQSASLAPLGSSTLIQEHHARMPAQTVGLEPTQMPLLLLVQGVALENTAQTLQQQVQPIASHVWLERLAPLLEQQVKMLVYLVKQGNMSPQMER